MDPCAPLATTGIDGTTGVVIAVIAVALLIGGGLVLRRVRGRAATLALVAAVGLVIGGFAMTGGAAPASASEPSSTCETAAPTPGATTAPTETAAPTTTPTDTTSPTPTETTPVATGTVRVTWDAEATPECSPATPNPNVVLVVDDSRREIVASFPFATATAGDTTIDSLELPGTYRVVVTTHVPDAYPETGAFDAPAAFEPCGDGFGYTTTGPSIDPIELTVDAPGAEVVLGLSAGCVAVNDKSNTDDTDRDGVVDACDQDSDDDGIPDSREDTNQNGMFEDDDIDGVYGPVAVLGDGTSNYLDLDCDNDAFMDLHESGIPVPVLAEIDVDRNGVIDAGVARGKNGFADVLETTPDSGVPLYAWGNADGDDKADSIDLNSNGVDYDLHLVDPNLDVDGFTFLSVTSDEDHDGIMNQVDTDTVERGAPGSPIPPHAPTA